MSCKSTHDNQKNARISTSPAHIKTLQFRLVPPFLSISKVNLYIIHTWPAHILYNMYLSYMHIQWTNTHTLACIMCIIQTLFRYGFEVHMQQLVCRCYHSTTLDVYNLCKSTIKPLAFTSDVARRHRGCFSV